MAHPDPLQLDFYFLGHPKDPCLTRLKIVSGQADGRIVVVLGTEVHRLFGTAEALDRGAVTAHKAGYHVSVFGILLSFR